MKSAMSFITSERERLKQYLDHETCPPTSPQVVGLKNALATVGENTVTQTLPRSNPPKIRQGFRFASDYHSSQMPFPPTPLTQRDTSASLSQGRLAPDVIPAHLIPFSAAVLLFPYQLKTIIVVLVSEKNIWDLEIMDVTRIPFCILCLKRSTHSCFFRLWPRTLIWESVWARFTPTLKSLRMW